MSFFRRISATVAANLDRAVSQIENHDAVAEAALADVRDAAARLEVQLARAKTESARIEQRADALEAQEGTWAERARSLAHSDEPRALACLSRRKACQDARDAMQVRLERQRKLERSLGKARERVYERLNELSARRAELQGRQFSAQGAEVVARLDQPAGLDVDRVFERWEVEVTRSELASDSGSVMGFGYDGEPLDSLAEDFERAETKAELRDELEALKASTEAGSDVEQETRR